MRRARLRTLFTPARFGVAAAVLVGVGVPVAIAAASGSLSIPHNDGWAYSRIARTFAETGAIHLLDWNRSTIIGLFVPLGPLGASLVVQQLWVAVLGAVLLVATFVLVRRYVGDVRALLVIAAVAIYPGFALLSTSFMTDVPYAAASILCVLLGTLAVERDSRLLFAAALVIGLWGCTIRVQAVAALVAVVAVASIAGPRARRLRIVPVLGFAAVAALALAGFLAWQNGLPRGDHPVWALSPRAVVDVPLTAIRAFFGVSLVAAPVVLLSGGVVAWTRRSWIAAVLGAAVGVAVIVRTGRDGLLLPNYLAQTGPYSGVLAPSRILFPDPVWTAVLCYAVAAGGVCAGALLAPARNGRLGVLGLARTPLGIFTALTFAGTVATEAWSQQVFDRYLIPLIAGALVLLLRREAGPVVGSRAVGARVAGGVAAVSIGVASCAVALAGWSYDRARWDLAESQVAHGTPAARIDAGLEWLGWHSADGVVDRFPTSTWGFEGNFAAVPCTVFVPTPALPAARPGAWVLRGTTMYPTWLVSGSSVLEIYDTGACGR